MSFNILAECSHCGEMVEVSRLEWVGREMIEAIARNEHNSSNTKDCNHTFCRHNNGLDMNDVPCEVVGEVVRKELIEDGTLILN